MFISYFKSLSYLLKLAIQLKKKMIQEQYSFSYFYRGSWIQFQYRIFFKLGFAPGKAEQPLRGMELQEKHKKDYRIQKVCLERTYS